MAMDYRSLEAASLEHLRDGLRMTVAERWQWLRQAIALGAATARARAAKGLISLGPNGELMWSPLHETLWTREQRLPEPEELATLGAGSRQ